MPASPASAQERPLLDTIAPKSSWLRQSRSRTSGRYGGGGNRTRVRGRTGQSVYKLRQPLAFARRPVGCRPTDGLAILQCRVSGDWLSLRAEPVLGAAARATGRARSDVAT